MFQSLIIAFSTYSKIPMPRAKWDEKGMRFSMCFFPLVGAVIGAVNLGIYYLLTEIANVTPFLLATLLTLVPIFITGGIHMDGFLDTIDAKSSYKSKEEKLEILKDPHTGAFAIIWGIVYFLLYEGLMVELMSQKLSIVPEAIFSTSIKNVSNSALLIYVISFLYIRALSGLSVVSLTKAKKNGMLAETAKASDKTVKGFMILWTIVVAVGMVIINPILGGASTVAGLLTFAYYAKMSKDKFGGITGDLAGYFLQLAEIVNLAVLLIFVLICQN